jgi:hypothetical protein
MNAKQEAVPSPGTSAAAQAAYLDQQIAINKDALAQLRALAEPPADAAAMQALFAQLDGLIGLAQQESAAIRAGNKTRADQIDAQLTTATDAANAAYRAYGLTVCGS